MSQEEKIQALRDLGYDVQVIDGKPTIKGGICLDSDSREIISLLDNLVVGGYLYLSGTDITSLPKNLVVSGSLYLDNTNITLLPNNLVVGGSLDLRNTNITSLPDNLAVGGSLYLSGTDITSLPDNLVVDGSLYLNGTKITSLPDNLIVGGILDLTDTKITSLPKNLVVGGSLYLRNTNITSLPDSLIVGGSLYLDKTKFTLLPDNLLINDIVNLDHSNVKEVVWFSPPLGNVMDINQELNVDLVKKIWGDKPYCCVDGIFTEVVKRRGKVWTVRNIGETDTFYIVNDGNGNYAHGETIKDAKEDLIYKTTSKYKSDYENLTLDSTLSHEEAIKCYRTITGACSFGAKNFVENILPQDERKEQYTIAEIIRITKGQYGNERFTEFFENKSNKNKQL